MIAANNAPTLENHNIILRLPIKSDIIIRAKLGLNMECVKMCGGNVSKIDEFTLDDAIKWYERIIQLYEKFEFEKEGIKRLAGIRFGKYENEYLMARINPNCIK